MARAGCKGSSCGVPSVSSMIAHDMKPNSRLVLSLHNAQVLASSEPCPARWTCLSCMSGNRVGVRHKSLTPALNVFQLPTSNHIMFKK
jgi:hypothetical protein